jgi:ABC-2 type transport system ATP-binding protein
LLGDPPVLLFDEPANGLDPEGILWIRTFMRHLAGQGRTVLVSSHLLAEMSLTADDLVVIGKGRLISQGTVQAFVDAAAGTWVHVRSPHAAHLASLVGHLPGATSRTNPDGSVDLFNTTTDAVGELAARARVVLHELSNHQASLEEAFLEATRDAQEYRAHGGPDEPSAGPPPSAPAGWGPPAAGGPS